MGDFISSTPISIQIRKVIFEDYNEPDAKFTNDEIFERLKKNGNIDSGLARNIAQNFTTIWMKLFSPIEKIHCNSCNLDVYLGPEEERTCPNPSCKSKV